MSTSYSSKRQSGGAGGAMPTVNNEGLPPPSYSPPRPGSAPAINPTYQSMISSPSTTAIVTAPNGTSTHFPAAVEIDVDTGNTVVPQHLKHLLSQPAPPPIVVMPAERRTVIGGHLPVEVDCEHCHAHIVTQTQRVREDSGNCCLGVFVPTAACLLLIPLGLMVISWLNMTEREQRANDDHAKLVCVAIVLCLLLCCCLPRVCRAKHDWRIYHFCPSCGKRLANVPADAPTSMGHRYTVQRV